MSVSHERRRPQPAAARGAHRSGLRAALRDRGAPPPVAPRRYYYYYYYYYYYHYYYYYPIYQNSLLFNLARILTNSQDSD